MKAGGEGGKHLKVLVELVGVDEIVERFGDGAVADAQSVDNGVPVGARGFDFVGDIADGFGGVDGH